MRDKSNLLEENWETIACERKGGGTGKGNKEV